MHAPIRSCTAVWYANMAMVLGISMSQTGLGRGLLGPLAGPPPGLAVAHCNEYFRGAPALAFVRSAGAPGTRPPERIFGHLQTGHMHTALQERELR